MMQVALARAGENCTGTAPVGQSTELSLWSSPQKDQTTAWPFTLTCTPKEVQVHVIPCVATCWFVRVHPGRFS